MRIRQVKPDFWGDELVASWPEGLRLFYVGLWCIADDAGYFEERPGQIAADLYPYQSRLVRERNVKARLDRLAEDGRIVRLGACGCVAIPKMPDHQRVGGNRSFTIRDRHRKHQSGRVHTDMDESDGKVSNGRVSKGSAERPALAVACAECGASVGDPCQGVRGERWAVHQSRMDVYRATGGMTDFDEAMASAGVRPAIVGRG
jgi:hypothetical protein